MMKFFASLLLIALASCSHSNQPIPGSMACQKPKGIPAGDLLLFGEMHGSKEAPAVISEITCVLSNSNNIAVGIEAPSVDQPLIDGRVQLRNATPAVVKGFRRFSLSNLTAKWSCPWPQAA